MRAGDRDLRESWLVALALFLLAVTNFAPFSPQLGLLHDDWPLVHDLARGAVPISSPDGLRPLLGLPWRLCGLLFGDALAGYYAFLFALQWLAAVLLYLLARRYGPAGFGAALAALSMVYPGDASHLWLGTLTQRTAWVLALASLLLAERSRERAGWMVPAMLLAIASLGLYELQILLLAFWPGVAWLLGAPWRRRLVVVWSVVPVLYVAWRFVARPVLGAPTVATATFLWEPLHLARRVGLLVPYNLFLDGWMIGLAEATGEGWLVVASFLIVATAVTMALATRWAWGPAPSPRYWLAALALVGLGVAPIVPTTYWLGRASGTYGARILAAALPGAALCVLLGIARMALRPRSRALAFSVALTLAFAFHWNVGRLAAENWSVQRVLAKALVAASSSWPRGSFLVILDLPPNRLAYDTPWGVGRLIQETYGDTTLSGIGICSDKAPRAILSTESGDLLVQGGFYARVALTQVVVLRFQGGDLRPAPVTFLVDRLGPRRE